MCYSGEKLRLEPFWICQAHSTRPVTHVPDGFTDLRPRLGTYGSPSYGGEQVAVRRTTPKGVKSLHGIALAHPEERYVHYSREHLRLEPSWIC